MKYLYIGPIHRLHSLGDLACLALFESVGPVRRFLSGKFVFELKGKRHRELMESPDGLGIRLNKQMV